ncbi:lipid-binding SYLF domain-containing protein [Vibrio mexicanus]|uniref:lipid-binding SYLF domain-containing protein n=1 Tax=Vibrio mexicanus TaxID=1004326 RepID=UPI00063C06DD|nr:lipid-binding SYLF domain-containing protein [Vibrio mexicanus]
MSKSKNYTLKIIKLATMFLLSSLSSVACFASEVPSQIEPPKHLSSAQQRMYEKATDVLQQADSQFMRFDENEYWDSVKTTTGIAKAVVIFPSSHQLGFIVGAQWGRGIMLTRQNHQWSAPVFVRYSSLMFGLLAGMQQVQGIGVILSDDVVKDIMKKPLRLGASADLTIIKGVSGKLVAGAEGISALMISENRGAYFGGSMDSVQITPDNTLNRAVYGPKVDIDKILSHEVSPSSPLADNLVKRLEVSAFNSVFNQQ